MPKKKDAPGYHFQFTRTPLTSSTAETAAILFKRAANSILFYASKIAESIETGKLD